MGDIKEIKKAVNKYWTNKPYNHKIYWKTLRCKKCRISYYDWQIKTEKEIERNGFADSPAVCPILSMEEAEMCCDVSGDD